MDTDKIKEKIHSLYDSTLPFFTHNMDKKSTDVLVQNTRSFVEVEYNAMNSYEKYVFNSSYILLNILHFGFIHNIDYDVDLFKTRMDNLAYFVDYTKNSILDKKAFYPFSTNYSILNGKKILGVYSKEPVTIEGKLVLFTGEKPNDDKGVSLDCIIRPHFYGRNVIDFLNLYFSLCVSLCDYYYPNESLDEFMSFTNKWIDERDIVPLSWAEIIQSGGEKLVPPHSI
ncbi:MAG: hypothetical protein LBR68_02175 [Lachnoclostridium sp.]|jgi:hypothetical protein|nr:hypothetical protein [Lachnoclostridium sp.]